MTSAYGVTPQGQWRPLATLGDEAPVWAPPVAPDAPERVWYVGDIARLAGQFALSKATAPGPTAARAQSFDVEVRSVTGSKTTLLAALRELLGGTLLEASGVVSDLPATVLSGVDRAAAERAAALLARSGATVLVNLHRPQPLLAREELTTAYQAASPATAEEPVVGADYVVITREAISAALEADRPVLGELPAQQRTGEAAALMRDLRRMFEGARLVGPPTEAAVHPMAERIGPMLTTNDVVRATRTTRQNLAAQARKRRLVRLASSERTQWWPTFQFRRSGSRVVPHPGVQALWQALPGGTVSDWDHATWVCTPRRDLDGDAPLDLATDAEAVRRSPLREVVAAYADRLTR